MSTEFKAWWDRHQNDNIRRECGQTWCMYYVPGTDHYFTKEFPIDAIEDERKQTEEWIG